jgi:hypothetical protein
VLVRTAEMIFGHNIGMLKGKTVRKKSLLAASDYLKSQKN